MRYFEDTQTHGILFHKQMYVRPDLNMAAVHRYIDQEENCVGNEMVQINTRQITMNRESLRL